MGTPDFAVETLSVLVKQHYRIVGVVTAPDKPAGRGRKMRASAVKKYALENGLQLLQPTNLKAPSFIEALKALNANLQVVVAFRMLPKIVWQMPAYGTFNLHASLLPDYRGAAPINWAIINGERQTGVTTFFIDDKIDTGAIILQEKVEIDLEDTAGSLHDKLMVAGAALVLRTTALIAENKAITTQQVVPEATLLKTANKIHKENCEIDWDKSRESIQNLIRGLSPYPTAWTTIINEEEQLHLKVYASNMEIADHQLANGSIVTNKSEFKVAVASGYISLTEIQLAGKRRMVIKDALNGLNLSKKAHMA